MFLSALGAPVAVQNCNNERLRSDAPLLISSVKSLSYGPLPVDWCGCLYATKPVIEETWSRLNELRAVSKCSIKELTPNVCTAVQMCAGESVTVTAIPIETLQRGSKVLFLVKDLYITRLCADSLSDHLNALAFNPVLRKAIADGVDVLHLDNTVFTKLPQPELVDHPTEFQLRALAYIVCPRKVVGLHAHGLPKQIVDCCQEVDYYRDCAANTTSGSDAEDAA